MPTVISNGIEIHYEEQGSGDPLILIMGLGAPGSRWQDHAAAYEKYFRCILMDNRGAGESDKTTWSLYHQEDGGRHSRFDDRAGNRKCQHRWHLYG